MDRKLRNITLFLLLIMISIGLAVVLSWLIREPWLLQMNMSYIPMMPITALFFIILGSIAFIYILKSRTSIQLFNWILLILAFINLVVFIDSLTGYFFDFEKKLEIKSFLFDNKPVGRMSPATSLMFFLASFSLFLSKYRRKIVSKIVLISSFFGSFVSFILLLGYVYETPLLYDHEIIPPALTTSFSFLLLFSALILHCNMNQWPFSLFIGDKIQSKLIRNILPWVMLSILCMGGLHSIGNYFNVDHVVATVLITLFAMIIVGWIIVKVSRELGAHIEELVFKESSAQQALIESELHFKTLANSGQVLIWTSGLDMKCNYFNEKWLEFTGQTLEHEIGDGWTKGVHPDDFETCVSTYVRAFQQREPFEMDYRILHKSGGFRWIQDMGAPRYDTQGQFLGYIGHCLDITNIKSTEQKLEWEQKLSQAIRDSVPGYQYVYNEKGCLVHWNKNQETMTGYSAEELLNIHFSTWFKGDDLTRIQKAFKQIFKTGSGSIEAPLVLKDGTNVDLLLTGVVFDLDGERFITGIGLDISELKQARLALEHQLTTLTSPSVNLDDVQFLDLFNLDEIQNIQDAFAEATGVAAIITTTEGIPITQPSKFCNLCQNIIRKTDIGLQNCHQSDSVIGRMNSKGPSMQRCLSGGLWDGGASIRVGEKHVANWLIGQVIDASSNENQILEYGNIIGADPVAFKESLGEVTRMSIQQFENICKMLFQITEQLSRMAIQNVQQARDITRRKEAEQELIESELKYRRLIENLPHKIFIKNKNLEFVSCNDNFARELHIEPLQIQGKTDFDFFPHDIAEQYRESERQFMLAGVYSEIEEYSIVDGRECWTQKIKIPIKDSLGQVIGVQGLFMDITERKFIEETISRERVLLRTLIDNLPDPIYVKDMEGRKVLSNIADCINIGASSELDVIGKTDLELFPGDIGVRGFEDDQQVFTTGIPVINREEDFYDTEGNQRWLLTSKFPFYDLNGKIIGIIGVGRDITRRKKEGHEIHKLSVAMAQSPTSIAITNTSGYIEYVNSNFIENTGFSAEEKVGTLLHVFNTEIHSEKMVQAIWNCLKEGIEWVGEFYNRRKSGERYWEAVKLAPVKDDAGRMTSIIGISEDISAQKKLEAELVAAKEKAEENDRLKSAFLANMSHEIRTPLNSILGFTDLLVDSDIPQEEREMYGSIITESGNNLLAVINDVLDISKIESGQITLEIGPCKPSKILTDLKLEYELRAQHKGVELRLHPDVMNMNLEIHSDWMRIRQILINFIGNALKFTEHGFIELGIEVRDLEVHMWVQDSGIGIPQEYHDAIFERFRQLESASTRKYGGNGLGLAITKNLAELLGGHVEMESKSGEGSIFSVYLPLS